MRIASKLGATDWQAEQGINMVISTRELRILHAKCFVDQQFYWLPYGLLVSSSRSKSAGLGSELIVGLCSPSAFNSVQMRIFFDPTHEAMHLGLLKGNQK